MAVRKTVKINFVIRLAGIVLLAVIAGSMTVRATDNGLTREQATERLKERRRDLELAKEREQGLSKEAQQLNKEWGRINTQLIDVAKRVQTGESKLSEIEDRLGGLDA